MLFVRIVETSARVAATRSRLAKVEALAQCLREMAPQEIGIGVCLLSGEPRQGRIGIGYGLLREAMPADAASAPSLDLADVDRDAIARVIHLVGLARGDQLAAAEQTGARREGGQGGDGSGTWGACGGHDGQPSGSVWWGRGRPRPAGFPVRGRRLPANPATRQADTPP